MNSKFTQIGTLSVIFIIYTFSLLSWNGIQSLTNLIQRWSQDSELTIYLHEGAIASDVELVQTLVEKENTNLSFEYQSPEANQKMLNRLMPKSKKDFLNSQEINLSIPPHIIIRSEAKIIGEDLFNLFDRIVSQTAKLKFVESASYGKSWVTIYSQWLIKIEYFSIFFQVGLFLAVTFVIGNIIGLSLQSKREEIEIMELVGATSNMINKPFLFNGMAFLEPQ